MTNGRGLIIVGAGGHGRVVADIARALGRPVEGFLDDDEAAGGRVRRLAAVQAGIEAHAASCAFVVAVGDNSVRRRICEAVLAAGGELATLIHPTAVLAPDVEVGAGVVVMAGAVINTGSRIGRFSVVNTGAIVDHDNLIEENVHISPGCSLAGTVTCRRDSFIGTGASIIPKIEIGAGSYVGAGSAVTRDVPPGVLVAGCPAKVKRRL